MFSPPPVFFSSHGSGTVSLFSSSDSRQARFRFLQLFYRRRRSSMFFYPCTPPFSLADSLVFFFGLAPLPSVRAPRGFLLWVTIWSVYLTGLLFRPRLVPPPRSTDPHVLAGESRPTIFVVFGYSPAVRALVPSSYCAPSILVFSSRGPVRLISPCQTLVI